MTPNAASGTYSVSNPVTLASVNIFCDFEQVSGCAVAYIKPDSIANAAESIPELFQVNDVAYIRHRLTAGGTQSVAEVRQINAFSSVPLSMQVNANTDYTAPDDSGLGPYLYLGFVPAAQVPNVGPQGFNAGGMDFTFTNCDANNASRFVFFVNSAMAPSAGRNIIDETALMNAWISEANAAVTPVTADTFVTDYEVGFGGCGGLAQAIAYSTVNGVTLGMKAALTCPRPETVAMATFVVSAAERIPGTTVTYTCTNGLSVVSGSAVRTCQASSTWSGSAPVCG
ncbi:uncharacterized protein LOC128233769 [Mya arenaria]|nr:uncharacterized protein LOC128233769 [Mya arenaria]